MIADVPIIDRSFVEQQPDEAVSNILRPEGALILIDKPYGDSSFYVVNKVRKAITIATGIRRVKCGHAGTLDPLASGLLILASRGATKKLADLVGMDKTYLLKMRFGVTSESFDLEQPIEIVEGGENLTVDSVRNAIEKLVGEHSQVPPAHSAIKQQGQPVYKKARAGHAVTLAPRSVVVHSVEVVSIALPCAEFRVRVSKGTYIRSIVRDLAESLGTGGVLIELVRECIQDWSIENALTLDESVRLIEAAPPSTIHSS